MGLGSFTSRLLIPDLHAGVSQGQLQYCVYHPHTARPLCSRGLGDRGRDDGDDARLDLG